MQHDPVSQIARRTQRYWYEDGIWEIGFGLVNALLGAFYLLTARLNWDGPRSILLVGAQMAVLIGMFWSINRIVAFLKERITYPRTGYVAYRRPAPSTRMKKILITALLAAGMAALVGAMAVLQQTANRMPLVISVIMAGTLVFIGWRFGLARQYVTACLTVLWGAFVTFLQLGDQYSTGAFFAGFGTLILLSGLVTLSVYLRRTRPIAGDLSVLNIDTLSGDAGSEKSQDEQ